MVLDATIIFPIARREIKTVALVGNGTCVELGHEAQFQSFCGGNASLRDLENGSAVLRAEHVGDEGGHQPSQHGESVSL